MAPLEHDEQAKLFQWAAYQRIKYPELLNMFAVPNGGHRNVLVARKLKAEGVKAGVPDIFLAAPKGDYHGLFIEMKRKPNKMSELQIEWAERLKNNRYQFRLCYSADEAINIIENYLNLGNNNPVQTDTETARTTQGSD